MKNFAIAILLFFTVFILNACNKEESTHYTVSVVNNSGYLIKIMPYNHDVPDIEKSITLGHTEQFVIGTGFDRGIVNHGGFTTYNFQNADSVLIVYDDSFFVVHYSKNPEVPSTKSILDGHSRNILEYMNYEYTFNDVSKNRREAYYIYTFTEADYEFAKE